METQQRSGDFLGAARTSPGPCRQRPPPARGAELMHLLARLALRLPQKPFSEQTLRQKPGGAGASQNELHLHHAAPLPLFQISSRGRSASPPCLRFNDICFTRGTFPTLPRKELTRNPALAVSQLPSGASLSSSAEAEAAATVPGRGS